MLSAYSKVNEKPQNQCEEIQLLAFVSDSDWSIGIYFRSK